MFTVVQVGMRHSIFHGHKTFSLWVPRLGPKLPVWTGDAPLPPLASTPQIFGEPLPDPDFLLLCSPVVGQYLHSRVFSLAGSSYMERTGTTVCAQLITQIFTSTAVSVPGLTTTLEHGFPLVGTGKYLLFYSPSVPGRACASANPHCTWCAPATQCHKQHPPQPRESVTSAPAPLATVHTQCSANTVPCATHLLQPRTYSRGQKQHWFDF